MLIKGCVLNLPFSCENIFNVNKQFIFRIQPPTPNPIHIPHPHPTRSTSLKSSHINSLSLSSRDKKFPPEPNRTWLFTSLYFVANICHTSVGTLQNSVILLLYFTGVFFQHILFTLPGILSLYNLNTLLRLPDFSIFSLPVYLYFFNSYSSIPQNISFIPPFSSFSMPHSLTSASSRAVFVTLSSILKVFKVLLKSFHYQQGILNW